MLRDDLKFCKPEIGEIALFWLGQAGYVIKTDTGNVLALDLYLSRSCERIVNFKRISAAPISADEFVPNHVLITHFHPDHLDVDSVLEQAKNDDTRFIVSQCARDKCRELGITDDKMIVLKPEDSFADNGFTITATNCDHRPKAPLAIGFLIDFNGLKLYFAGDTCYRDDICREVAALKPQVAILPINGAYGNLNGIEAAKVANELNVQIAIPSHFWTFIEHSRPGGDPSDFCSAMQNIQNCQSLIFEIGEGLYLSLQDDGIVNVRRMIKEVNK